MLVNGLGYDRWRVCVRPCQASIDIDLEAMLALERREIILRGGAAQAALSLDDGALGPV
jgi:hypothetical protein